MSVSSHRPITASENNSKIDVVVSNGTTVREHTQTITFQTGSVRGREGKDGVREMSLLHCEQRHLFMHLYCYKEAGRGGNLPRRIEEFKSNH